MRQVVVSTLGLAVAGAIVAGAVVLAGIDRTDIVLDAYLVFVGGLIALASARIAAVAFPSPRRVVPKVLAQPVRRPARPESLAHVENVVALAQAGEFDLHFRLRPLLVEIASAELAARDGIDLTNEPERARARLSPLTWEIVRPDRGRPSHAAANGIDTASLTSIVSELERIAP